MCTGICIGESERNEILEGETDHCSAGSWSCHFVQLAFRSMPPRLFVCVYVWKPCDVYLQFEKKNALVLAVQLREVRCPIIIIEIETLIRGRHDSSGRISAVVKFMSCSNNISQGLIILVANFKVSLPRHLVANDAAYNSRKHAVVTLVSKCFIFVQLQL